MLLTPKDAFFEIYYSVVGKNDIDKYCNAVVAFEAKYGLKTPFKNYRSFKVSIGNTVKGMM